ncbi:MAG: hypothetical protein K0S07_296 [Chlamydiales bacterium]|jgi:hypothetical protein|nr:hypothetical protein [Chlamydiales bacterium]
MTESLINDTPVDPLDSLEQIREGESEPSNMSLETLLLFVNTERVRDIEARIQKEFAALKEGQEQVRFLHKVQKAINALSKEDGTLDISGNDELKQYFQEARQMGVPIDEGKVKFTVHERERLLENFQMTVEDLNTQNDMQLQTVTRLTNERYESFQLARSVLRPLHEDKLNKARAIGGR